KPLPAGRADDDPAAGSGVPQNREQIRGGKSDAALGRPIIGPRDMQENGASGAHLDGIVIVAQRHDEVVEPILAPETLGARRQGKADRAVILWRRGVVAPPVVGRNRLDGKAGPRQCQAVGAVEQAAHRPAAEGCRPVALALSSAEAAAPERAAKAPGAPQGLAIARDEQVHPQDIACPRSRDMLAAEVGAVALPRRARVRPTSPPPGTSVTSYS